MAQRIRMMLAVLLGVTMIALVGCGASGGEDTSKKDKTSEESEKKDDEADTTSDEDEETTTTEADEEEETTTTEADDSEPSSENPMFGDTFTWDDGISITVGEPVEFTPSEYAAFEDAEAYVSFEITIENGSDENFDPSSVYETVQSGSSEGSSVFDSDQDIGSAPYTTLLAGRSVTYTVGYGVSDPSDIVMEISPGFDYDSAIFTNF